MDGRYTIPEGVYITRSLREEFLNLRYKYRDQHRPRNEPIPLRNLPKIPGPAAPRLPRIPAPEPKTSLVTPIPIRSRGTRRSERRAQKERVQNVRANKDKGKES
jgi:hypothetical protein